VAVKKFQLRDYVPRLNRTQLHQSPCLGHCWRKIAISLIDVEKGEVKAQACDNACYQHQLATAASRMDEMERTPEAVLRQLAHRTGRKVRSIKHLDPNVCTSHDTPEKPWQVVEEPLGDLFSKSISFDCDGHKVTIRSNREYLSIQVRSELYVDVCSINRQDRIGWKLVEPTLPDWFPFPVFSQKAELTSSQRQMLYSPEPSRLIIMLGFEDNESLHFYRNGLVAYVHPISVEEALAVVQQMCVVANLKDSSTRA
jgi:hypothetical protein